MNPLLTILALLCCIVTSAQKNLMPATTSDITGIALPQGSKLDKRLLNRIAAKATMDMEAKDAGLALSDNYEVFLLPPSSENDMSDAIITNLENEHWKLTVSAKDNKWGWIEKAGKKCIIYFDGKEKESWLYIAEVSQQNSPASQPAASTSVSKPTVLQPTNNNSAFTGFKFSTTNFNDGWVANALPDFVGLSKAGTELRLQYTDQPLDNPRPNTIDAPENYWSKYVAPYYDVPAPEKWSGVQYPET
jgi:hypothetical protein